MINLLHMHEMIKSVLYLIHIHNLYSVKLLGDIKNLRAFAKIFHKRTSF